MIKNIRNKTTRIAVLLFVITALVGGMDFFTTYPHRTFVASVYADDGEQEYEYEGEVYKDGAGDTSSNVSTSKIKNVPIYKTVLVTKIITTLDPIFTTDQDGDSLVDGLDPHPTMHEREYFTDDDDDGVPNVFDKYRDDDDFAYYEEENDENGDGILDSYEFMGER